MNTILQVILYLWSYIAMTVILLPISIIALPFPKMYRVAITTPFWKFYFKVIVKTIYMSKVTLIDRRPLEVQKEISPKGLYIANHKSFADIPLLFSFFVIPPIMKKEVIYIPIFGICAYSAGGILVDRKAKDSRKKVFEESKERLISHRKQLQYYPEGTRQQGDKPIRPVTEIKTALIEFAFENNILVYPVSMEGTQNVMQGSKIKPFEPLGVILHEPVKPQEFANKEQFIEYAWGKVIEGKKELESIIYS